VLHYVEQPVIREDLKLTNDQQSRIEGLRKRLEATDLADRSAHGPFALEQAIASSDAAKAVLIEILTPAQIERHQQIVRQHLLIRFGLVQLIQVPDVAEQLALDDRQREKIETILTGTGAAPGSAAGSGASDASFAQQYRNRRRSGGTGFGRQESRILDEFTNPDLSEIPARERTEAYESANDQISALLTADQKRRLLESLGPPLAARPDGSPPPILRAGSEAFAFPRVSVRALWDRSARLGGKSLVRLRVLPRVLEQEAVRRELGLTSQVQQRLPPFSGDPNELSTYHETINQVLSAGQLKRLQQLVLQTIERYCDRGSLFEYREVANAVSLDDRQRASLAELLRSEIRSTRQAVLAAVERDPVRRREIDVRADERLNGILTDLQRAELAALLGNPFSGKLSSAVIEREIVPRISVRAQVAPAIGYLTSLPESLAYRAHIEQPRATAPSAEEAARLRAALQGGAAMRGLRSASGPSTAMPSTALPGFALPGFALSRQAFATQYPWQSGGPRPLTREQQQRSAQVGLQGVMKSLGPAGILRYRSVVDALSLSQDQRSRLLDALWDDTRRYLETPLPELAERMPVLNQQAARSIDEILSPEQHLRLTSLVGEPADVVEDAAEASGIPAAVPAQAAPPVPSTRQPAGLRRLAYAVRHGSAEDLVALVRERFPGEVDDLSVANNVLMMSVKPSAFDNIREALTQLDRPRRTVIVDLLLVELHPPGSAGASDGWEFEERDTSGPIEQVAARLQALCQQKKFAGLRQLRLVCREGVEGQIQNGAESSQIRDISRNFVNGLLTPTLLRRMTGTIIQVKPSVSEGNVVVLQMTLRDGRKPAPGGGAEHWIGVGRDGPIMAEPIVSTNLTATLQVPIGQAVLATDKMVGDKSSGAELRMIVGARLSTEAAPIETPTGGAARDPVVSAIPRTNADRPFVTKRLVYVARRTSAGDLVAILKQHFAGETEFQVAAEAATNSVLIAGPEPLFDEAAGILGLLDRPSKRVVVDVIIAEVVARGTDITEFGLDDRDLEGPVEQVLARLQSLENEKKLTVLNQFRNETQIHRLAQAQSGAERRLVNGFTTLGTAGVSIPTITPRQLGTVIQITPRDTRAGQAQLELLGRCDRPGAPEDGIFLADGEKGPIINRAVVTSSLTTALSVPVGQAVVAHRCRDDSSSKRTEFRIIVAARTDSDDSPEAVEVFRKSHPGPLPAASISDSGTKRFVHSARHVAAGDLSMALEGHFDHEAGVLVTAEPLSNSVMITAPAPVIDEVAQTLAAVDRPPRRLLVDVIVAEASGREIEATRQALHDRELAGPIDRVLKHLEALERQKNLDTLTQWRIEALENHVGSLQIGKEMRLINGFTSAGINIPTVMSRQVGAVVQITPRVTGSGRVQLEFVFRGDQLGAPEDGLFLAMGAKGPLVVPQIETANLVSLLTVPVGQAVVASRVHENSDSNPKERVVVVAARFADELVPQDIAVASPAGLRRARANYADGARSRRLVAPESYVPTKNVAAVLEPHFQGAVQFQTASEPLRNSLLAAGPVPVFDELSQALSQLDRPLENVIVDVVFAELSTSAAGMAGTALEDRELEGPIEQVLIRLQALEKEKRLTVLHQMQIETQENQNGQFQAGEETPRVSGVMVSGATGVNNPIVFTRQLGVVAQVRPHVVDSSHARIEIAFRRDRMGAPDEGVYLAEGAKGPLIAGAVSTANLQTVVTVPMGRAVVAGRIRSLSQASQTEFRLIVAARPGRPSVPRPLKETARDASASPPGQARKAAGKKQLAYAVRTGAANELAALLEKHFQGETEILIAAEPGKDRLQIAAAPDLANEAAATLARVDRPPQKVVVDLFAVEPLSSPETGADATNRGFSDDECTGPVDEVLARLEARARQKTIADFKHLEVATIENRRGVRQSGEEVPRTTGFTPNPGTGGATPVNQVRGVPAVFRVTPRAVEAGRVLLELSFRKDRMRPPEEGIYLAEGVDGPIYSQVFETANLDTIVAVPIGQAVLVGRVQTTGDSKQSQIRLIVAARVEEESHVPLKKEK
jgi:type II secretory pathway component GspD/PulD (secretin)